MSLSQEEADRMCAEIQAQVVKPELPKVGQLCEFWDVNGSKCMGRFGRFVDPYYENVEGDRWMLCQPLQTPATPIPWNGGECPVGPDTWVVVEYRNGHRVLSLYAGSLEWSHSEKIDDIVGYWILER